MQRYSTPYPGREGFNESGETVIVDNEVRVPRRAHTAYIYPGLVLGCLVSKATHIRDDQLVAAAKAVAQCVSPEDAKRGLIYPQLGSLVDVSMAVARAVALVAYEGGYASQLPKPHKIE